MGIEKFIHNIREKTSSSRCSLYGRNVGRVFSAKIWEAIVMLLISSLRYWCISRVNGVFESTEVYAPSS